MIGTPILETILVQMCKSVDELPQKSVKLHILDDLEETISFYHKIYYLYFL